MIITSIKKSKKGNILIYADHNYLVSVTPEVFLKSRLKEGDYIDDDILSKLNESTNLDKAKEKALNLLSFRAHSKNELKSKLKRSLDEKSAEYAANKMEQMGLVNDEEFAETYASELFFKKFYSVKRVEYELSKKGISSDIIYNVIEKINADERKNISKILEKKHINKETLKDEKIYRKIVTYCQRLGYNWSDINRAIELID